MSVVENKSTVLSDHACEVIDKWMKNYPAERKQSVVITALTVVQEDNGGSLNTDVMDAVAEYLEMPRIAVYEVASFYSMFDLKPVGRHKIAVCTNISCLLCGGDKILDYVTSMLGVEVGETTADGKFTVKREEECLAACCGAPMMAVNGHYHENLTPEKIDAILDGLE